MEIRSIHEEKIYYVSGPLGSSDGAQIYDQKLVSALSELDVSVSTFHPRRKRALRVPFWQGQLLDIEQSLTQLLRAREEGAKIVLSHEVFFEIAHNLPVDLLIVHNYMPGFSFPGKLWLNAYYRFGSRSFFERAFKNARAIFFVSYRDHRNAVSDFPEISARSYVLPPPPHRSDLGRRRDDLIHVSGSEEWLPKRLSRLTEADLLGIHEAGFKVGDFGARPSPAFGLISDRFSVGFKLKLMQMLYMGDVVASLADIREEVEALAPNYPYWCEVSGVSEAIAWFREVRDDMRLECIEKQMDVFHTSIELPSWFDTARKLVEIVCVRDNTFANNA